MNEYRVWVGAQRSEYQDVKGKNMDSVITRFFGKSEKILARGEDTGTAQILKPAKGGGYDVLGYIREYSKTSWGGKREGAGRPATGRKKKNIYVTAERNENKWT